MSVYVHIRLYSSIFVSIRLYSSPIPSFIELVLTSFPLCTVATESSTTWVVDDSDLEIHPDATFNDPQALHAALAAAGTGDDDDGFGDNDDNDSGDDGGTAVGVGTSMSVGTSVSMGMRGPLPSGRFTVTCVPPSGAASAASAGAACNIDTLTLVNNNIDADADANTNTHPPPPLKLLPTGIQVLALTFIPDDSENFEVVSVHARVNVKVAIASVQWERFGKVDASVPDGDGGGDGDGHTVDTAATALTIGTTSSAGTGAGAGAGAGADALETSVFLPKLFVGDTIDETVRRLIATLPPPHSTQPSIGYDPPNGHVLTAADVSEAFYCYARVYVEEEGGEESCNYKEIRERLAFQVCHRRSDPAAMARLAQPQPSKAYGGKKDVDTLLRTGEKVF